MRTNFFLRALIYTCVIAIILIASNAANAATVRSMYLPNFKGYANANAAGTTTWHWTGTAWTKLSLQPGEKVYAQYFASGWTWTWTSRLGWTATTSNKVDIPLGNAFMSTTAYTSPYFEMDEPTGAWLNKPARGIMLVIHGGGMFGDKPAAVVDHRPLSNIWRGRGWLVLNVDYRTGIPALTDINVFYDRVRAMGTSGSKICATGDSAGGYFSFMLSINRPQLNCVISMAGVTDMVILPPFVKSTFAFAGLSDPELKALSPLTYASSIRAKVLMSVGVTDVFTPPIQHQLMKRARPDFEITELQPGGFPFVHTGISNEEYLRYLILENNFSERVLAS